MITGASSGIGLEMAKMLAKKNYNLILIARSEQRLNQIQKELTEKHNVVIQIMLIDLAEKNAAQDIYNQVKENNWQVAGLINNAGFGDYGNFVEMPLNNDEEMIAVNVTALVGLTKLFASDMVKNKVGRIMNVASILSFLPFPYYSVYSATKSFVLSFTETIAAELSSSGVIVTALCPGTIETAFHTENMRKTNAMKSNKPMSAERVAKDGVDLFLNGKGKKIVGFKNWFISNLPRFIPDKLMMKIKTNLASIQS